LWPDGGIARSIRSARALRWESGCRPACEAQGGPTGCPGVCLSPFLCVSLDRGFPPPDAGGAGSVGAIVLPLFIRGCSEVDVALATGLDPASLKR
jgi:hypothetical protein